MLTDRQKQAAKLLSIDGMSVQDTAEAVGVHRCTIWRWRCKKEFCKECTRLARAYIRQRRKASGYYKKLAAWRAKLRRLEKELDEAAAEVRMGDTAAYDRAYDRYEACLLERQLDPFFTEQT